MENQVDSIKANSPGGQADLLQMRSEPPPVPLHMVQAASLEEALCQPTPVPTSSTSLLLGSASSRSGHLDIHVMSGRGNNGSTWKAIGVSALAATIATLLGEAICFAMLHFVIPAWTSFLDTKFSGASEDDINHAVNSRVGDLVVLFIFLPWVIVYLVALLTAFVAGRLAGTAVEKLEIRSIILGISLSITAVSIPAAIAWTVTGLLYSDSNSVALLVHRLLLTCGEILFAATFAIAAVRGLSAQRNGKAGAVQSPPAASLANLLAIGVVTAVIVGIRHEGVSQAQTFDLKTYKLDTKNIPVPPFKPRLAPLEAPYPAPASPNPASSTTKLGADYVTHLQQAAQAGDARAMYELAARGFTPCSPVRE